MRVRTFVCVIVILRLINYGLSLKLQVGSGDRICSSKLVPKLERAVKLPVWPVWSGVGAQVADWMNLRTVSQNIVNSIGGRVVPMHLSEQENSPFLLLVHHSHSFCKLDPLRYVSRLLLPEGFPAHPHAGFDTVTICLEGGLKHRDSAGEAMSYGDGDVQWMRAGKGVIHEEMWNLDALRAPVKDTLSKNSPEVLAHNGGSSERKLWQRIEIFQLWVNLPKQNKDDSAGLHLLKAANIPSVVCANGATVRVICGDVIADCEAQGNLSDKSQPAASKRVQNALDIASSPMKIHANYGACTQNSAIDILRGSLLLGDNARPGTPQEVHQETLLSYSAPIPITRSGTPPGNARPSTSTLELSAGKNGLDALVLVGEKLNEPVHWQGPLVQADQESLRRRAAAFDDLPGAAYWEHTLSDKEWRQRLRQLHLQDRLSAG